MGESNIIEFLTREDRKKSKAFQYCLITVKQMQRANRLKYLEKMSALSTSDYSTLQSRSLEEIMKTPHKPTPESYQRICERLTKARAENKI